MVVDIGEGRVINSFAPTEALGAGVDRLPMGATETLLSKSVLDKVLQSGWQTVTYRQNTELEAEAWHWNPQGKWSDPAGKGYFTGDATPGKPIAHSWGYSLPHRGFTPAGGGPSNYSRLDDGETNTYWKSNPYLSKHFLGEERPQWVVVDLKTKQEVNAIRIAWGEPYARSYMVEYWKGEDAMGKAGEGSWTPFPKGKVMDGKGGSADLTLMEMPMEVRFVRVWMTESSGSCDDHGSQDIRNCLGYAIRELYLGTKTADGKFHDAVYHKADKTQTQMYCSSVDPWHTPEDEYRKGGDQAGFDLFFQSGVTRGLPAMVPIAMLYGTPDDAVAELAYLEKRHYPISYVEMGEEPDGQYVQPEDDAALYVLFAKKLHALDPKLKLGGPVFQGVNEDIEAWPDAAGKTSWFGRFLDYLKAHDAMNELAFFSFEHYPYEPCETSWDMLYKEPQLITHIMDVWRKDGLPEDVPMFNTETNLSWNLNGRFMDMFGALWTADSIGAFLAAGGKATYHFHYLPFEAGHGCGGSWGTFSMQTADKQHQVESPTAEFFASQVVSRTWVQPGDGIHKMYPAESDVKDAAQHTLVTAYAVLRPDGQWSLLLLNKDPEEAHAVKPEFRQGAGRMFYFRGKVNVTTFGAAQYKWHVDGQNGYADPAGPPASSVVQAAEETRFELPKKSIVVLTGMIDQR